MSKYFTIFFSGLKDLSGNWVVFISLIKMEDNDINYVLFDVPKTLSCHMIQWLGYAKVQDTPAFVNGDSYTKYHLT